METSTQVPKPRTSSQISVFYVVQGDRGEDVSHPNLFLLPVEQRDAKRFTLGYLKARLALLGDFHWRFRVAKAGPNKGFAWHDLCGDDAPVPMQSATSVFAKLLRLDSLRVVVPKGFAPKVGGARRNEKPRKAVSARKQPNMGSKDDGQGLFVEFSCEPTFPEQQQVQKKKEDDFSDHPSLKGLKGDARAMKRIELRRERERQRQEEKVEELRKRDTDARKLQEDFDRLARVLNGKIQQWSGPEGNPKNIRALLGSLHTILWENAKWQPVSVLVRPQDVKKAYYKAMLVVHPDKIKGDAPPEVKFIAQRCFHSLKTQYVKFEQRELS